MPDESSHADHEAGPDEESATREALWVALYEQLRVMAHNLVWNECDTLQATAVVNEAFLKMAGIEPRTPGEFVSVAGRAMRQVVIDHARSKHALKRGGDRSRIPLIADALRDRERAITPEELDEAMDHLTHASPRQAQIVELWLFAGLTHQQIAGLLEISERTVRAEWKLAKASLKGRLRDVP